jgi:hypothetical protein
MRLRLIGAFALCAVSLMPAASASAASSRACDPIVNPYEGTRYEGADLRRIRAVGVRCSRARSVVRGAHRKALGLSVPPNGVRHFSYRGWHVVGDIRGSTDRYVATRGGKRIRWVF